MEKILIIGGGQAAFSCASKLRVSGFEGKISIVCEENIYPYQRPPLSKKYLTGVFERDRLLLKSEEYYKKNNIEVFLSTRANKIIRKKKEVVLEDGRILSYTKLVFSTGSSPIKIFYEETKSVNNIYYLRNLDDAEKLKACLKPNKKLIVIGGGYLGLEIGSIASVQGMKVTVVESSERILKRVAGSPTAEFLKSIFKEEGVEIIENDAAQSLDMKENKISNIKLSSGRTIQTDLVVIAVGGTPEIGLAKACGLNIDLGIKVNEKLQTSDPSIYAAGDCASFDFRGQTNRFESVGNAIDQGETVALNIMQKNIEYKVKPWFWSDQFGIKLQIAGLSSGFDEIVKRICKGNISFWYYLNNQLIAVDAFNDPVSYFVGKRLLEDEKSIPQAVVANENCNLKDFLLKK